MCILWSARLDVAQLKIDFEGKALGLFEQDLKLASEFGARGFPTIFFVADSGAKEMVYGAKPYAFYEMAILKLNPNAQKSKYSKDWKTLFSAYSTLTAREFAELSGTPRKESEMQLNELSEKGILEKFTTKNGAIWRFKSA